MAINFLQDISLNNGQVTNFKVQNITGSLPSTLAGEGQLIYKSDTNELYLHKGANSWEELSTGGSVTSVGITETGSALSITNTPITSSGNINIAGAGTSSQVILGDLSLATLPVSGVTSVATSNGTFVNVTGGTITSTGTITGDLSASGTPSGTTFLRGDNVWATPSGSYTSWSLEGDNATTVDITDGLRVDFTGGAGISTSVASATPNTLTITNTGVTSLSGSSPISVDSASGAVTISYTGGTGTMSSWNLQGDTGGATAIGDSETVDIAGTGVISTSRSGNTITISSTAGAGTMSSWILSDGSNTTSITNGATATFSEGAYMTVGESSGTISIAHNTTSRSDTTSNDTVGSGGTFTKVDSISTNSTGHVTAINVETITMGSFDNYGSWTLAGDGGSSQTIASSNTATFVGGAGISTEAGTAADALTITNTGVTSATGSTGLSVSSGTGAVTFSNTGVTSVTGGTGINVSSGTGAVTITNTSTNTDANYALSVGAVSSNESTLSLVGSSGGSTTTAKFSGTSNEIEITTPTTGNGGDITIGLPAAVTVQTTLTVGSGGIDTSGALSVTGTGQSGFAGQVTIPSTPSASTDAASKNYVDTSIAGSGSLIYQGGYNASTNSPNLTSTGQGILKGFTYAVTAAGNASGFWSPTLEIGDLVIANQDNPASAADWTEINKNIDVATATVQGIANFPTAGGLSVSAGAVSMPTQSSNGTYGGVTKSLSTTIDTKGRVTAMSENTIAIPASQITDFCTAVASCINTNYNFKTTITGSSPYTVSHNLGTRDVMVYVYDNASPYDQKFVEVVHTNTDDVTISTATDLGTDVLKVLVVEVL
tara:strand:+ start:10023 stop:12518 length:2496 start_codon:yes stop_codon:yes gene_type:complete